MNHLLIDLVPPTEAVRRRLADAIRETQLLRRLLRLADLADYYRQFDAQTNGDINGTAAQEVAP